MDVNKGPKAKSVMESLPSKLGDLPPNSHKFKKAVMKADEAEYRENKIEKIVTGGVVQKKKRLSTKVKEMLIGDAATDVGSYILYDVLIPGAKTILYEMVMGGLEMRMWGETKTTRSRLGKQIGKPIVNYGLYSVGKGLNSIKDHDPIARRPARDIGEIVFDNKPDAVDVLLTIQSYIKEYGRCSVNVLYSLIGKTGDATDENWGWTDLDAANITSYRGNYILNLPRVKVLD